MSTPDDSEELSYARGVVFEPINETERRAAEDSSALQVPRAQWDSYLSRLKGRDVTPENIRLITNLPETDSQAIYKGLSARGLLEQEYRRTLRGRQLGRVTLRSEARVDEDNPPEEWGVVIVDHELNGHDHREREAQVFPPRPNSRANRQSRDRQADGEGRVPDPHHRRQGAGDTRRQRDPEAPQGPQGPKSREEAPYFDTARLLQLNASIAQAIREEAHRRKDERGIAKLPNDEFHEIAVETRNRLTRRYLGADASDDLAQRVDYARGSAVAAERRRSGPRR